MPPHPDGADTTVLYPTTGTAGAPPSGTAGSAAGPPSTGHNRGLVIGAIVAAVIAIVGLSAAVIVLATRGHTGTAQTTPTLAAPAPSVPDAVDATVATTVTTTAPTLPPTTVAPTLPPVTAPRTVPPTAPPTAPPVPAAAGIPFNSWVAMLGSLGSESEAQRHLADIQSVAPGARIIHSDDVPSLRPGFWIVYQGGYDSSGEAIDACFSMGFSDRDDCYAAYLSTNPADVHARVYPDGD